MRLLGYVRDSGRMSMGATSGHDDLVLSVAMACWLASKDAANGADSWIRFLKQRGTVAPQAEPTPILSREDARQAMFRGGRYA